MSTAINDPTVIQLDRGETKEIITDDQAQRGIPYLIQIDSDNGVRYAHDRRSADRGIQLSGRQTHTLSNFRGSGVYVQATEGPTKLRVRPAGADIESQPEQKVRITGGDLTLSSTVDVSSRDSRDLGDVDISSIPTVDVDVNDPLAQDSTLQTVITELQNAIDLQDQYTGVNSFSQTISSQSQLPTVNVPPGTQLTIKADTDNTDTILVDNVFPLSPGDGLSLRVANADELQVSPSSGTQTLYGIVEA